MLGRHHDDPLLHYGHALAQAQALDPFDQARERLQARAASSDELAARAHAGVPDTPAAETVGAQAAPGAGGAADRAGAPDNCACARCCARRIAEASRRVNELACRLQARLDTLAPSPPPLPAPHDADPDAQAAHVRARGARLHHR